MHQAAQDRDTESIARLETTLHAFEQEAVAAANWMENSEALNCEGYLYVESRYQDMKATRTSS